MINNCTIDLAGWMVISDQVLVADTSNTRKPSRLGVPFRDWLFCREGA